MDQALIGRVLSGNASPADCASLGVENVFAIKSDTGNKQTRFSIDRSFGVDAPTRTIKGVPHSTERVDRMGDIIRLKGWQLDDYKANPVLLFAHNDWKPPVARSLKPRQGRSVSGLKALLMDEQYHEASINPEAEIIWRMVSTGALPGRSVGFRPLEVRRPESDAEREKIGLGAYGVEFLSQELVESSIVPVPANADAIAGKGFVERCYTLARETVKRAVDAGEISDAIARRLADIVPITEDDAARIERERKRARVVVPDMSSIADSLVDAFEKAQLIVAPKVDVDAEPDAPADTGYLDPSFFAAKAIDTGNQEIEALRSQITELRADLAEERRQRAALVDSFTRTLDELREQRAPNGGRRSSSEGAGYGAAFDDIDRRRIARDKLAKLIAERVTGSTKA